MAKINVENLDPPQWRKVPNYDRYSVSHTGVVRDDIGQVDLVPVMFERVVLIEPGRSWVTTTRNLFRLVWPELAQ